MNKQHYKILVWLVIILLILNLSALGTILWFRFSGPPAPQSGCLPQYQKQHMRLHDSFIREEIGFDDAQLRDFKALRNKHIEEIQKIRKEIEDTRKQQFTVLREKTVNQARLDSLSSRIGTLHQEWAANSAEFLNRTRQICTPEQTSKLFQMMEESRSENLQWPGKQKGLHRKQQCQDPQNIE